MLMEEEIVFIFLLGIILFFIFNSKSKSPVQAKTVPQSSSVPVSDGTAVPLDVIQAVIEKFQSTQEDMVPIETLSFTPTGGGNYDASIMFMNTRHFFGQQFQIRANIDSNGLVRILDTNTTSQPVSYLNSYQPDTYQGYDDVTASLSGQLQSALTESKSNSFTTNLSNYFNTQGSLMSRASISS